MERELNKHFNDTNYNKENVILVIREIWSIKLEFPTFFEEFRCNSHIDPVNVVDVSTNYCNALTNIVTHTGQVSKAS